MRSRNWVRSLVRYWVKGTLTQGPPLCPSLVLV